MPEYTIWQLAINKYSSFSPNQEARKALFLFYIYIDTHTHTRGCHRSFIPSILIMERGGKRLGNEWKWVVGSRGVHADGYGCECRCRCGYL